MSCLLLAEDWRCREKSVDVAAFCTLNLESDSSFGFKSDSLFTSVCPWRWCNHRSATKYIDSVASLSGNTQNILIG
ncbi:MAG: hypothetical protein V7K98_27470 [Nostoc sp.]|uniref:hypothetical protein n=1 Tax=Nostoc sp. TaxID=1180 RepID=UPI002FF8FD89